MYKKRNLFTNLPKLVKRFIISERKKVQKKSSEGELNLKQLRKKIKIEKYERWCRFKKNFVVFKEKSFEKNYIKFFYKKILYIYLNKRLKKKKEKLYRILFF